jgi:hypothetical protein
MRVAFSGAHRTGKSSLVSAIAAHLPTYATVDEPYHLLEEEGYDFSDPPTAEDFHRQLRRSLELIADDASSDILFDRCPADFVAYLRGIDEDGAAGDDEDDDAVAEIREAMSTLDLIVLVPIEVPDRIVVPSFEDLRLRRDVDDVLQTLLLDDAFGIGVDVLEVRGDVDARVQQVLRAIRGG